MNHLKNSSSLLATILLLVSSTVSAHTAWLEPEAGQSDVYRLHFGGHAGVEEAYDAKKLISVSAYDSEGHSINVKKDETADGILLKVEESPSFFTLHFHNGIHSRDMQGRSFEMPMSELPNAREATNTPKYHKFIVEWNEASIKEQGQEFEVVPLDAEQPRAGQPMRVKVLMNGEPVEGIALGQGEEGNEGLTNAEGIATFTPQSGLNHMWAGKRFQVTDNKDYTELSYEYLFGFYAR